MDENLNKKYTIAAVFRRFLLYIRGHGSFAAGEEVVAENQTGDNDADGEQAPVEKKHDTHSDADPE